jgi:hypothetical protein
MADSFSDNDWYFLEHMPLDKELKVGMKTSQDVWEQVEKDISRIQICLNGVKITETELLFSKFDRNLSVLRHCTQSVFFKPLERLTLLFPNYILTHPRPEIVVYVKSHVCGGRFCKYLYNSHTSNLEFKISTVFRALDKNLFEKCFDIRWDLSFIHGGEKGILSYELV